MKQQLITLAAFSYALVVLAGDKGDEPNSDARAPDGVWKPVAAVYRGEMLSQPVIDALTLTISGTNYEVTGIGGGRDGGTCTVNKRATPYQMTIIGTNGPNRGKTMLAIYEMKDDRSLKVCYDLSATEFPKEFKAPKGTDLYLVEYRRANERSTGVPEHN
jgi:uncharacterized protein (TIGR03067 family)